VRDSLLVGELMGKTIYDFGMYNGDDTEYYLRKGFNVVGIEANPWLCDQCEKRFAASIAAGRLRILNVALSDESDVSPVTFYVHRKNAVLSQVLRPDEKSLPEFQEVKVAQMRASEIVHTHGVPHYIKIDLEGSDPIVLRDLLEAGIAPEFISAEVHSTTVFALLVAHGYDSFNLVDGSSVHEIYRAARIMTPDGEVDYSFAKHSAGPFGEDIASPWWDSNSFLYVLASERLGWKDIHASNVIRPNGHDPALKLRFKEHLRDLGPSIARAARDWVNSRSAPRRGVRA
jgi:FkbM family methyltransferase